MPASAEPPILLDVGRVARPHGLAGEVVVELWSDRPERLEQGSVLTADAGTLVVVRSRPHQARFLVVFESIRTREAADSLRGQVLRAAPLDLPGVLWAHELIGSRVELPGGRVVGTVTALEANPASDLLVLDDGSLVPLRFVVEHEPGSRVVVDAPGDLFDR